MRRILGFAIGLTGGFFGGLLGLGGGVVMVPLLTWLAKLKQHQAHGTSLVAIVFTAIMGAGTYLVHGNVSWKAALIIAASATATARLGALFAHSLPEKTLQKAFGWFLVFVVVMLVIKDFLLPKEGYDFSSWTTMALFLLIGGGSGFLSGMLGIGGGALMVGLMVVLTNMQQHLAQGTSLLAMVPASISGAMTHYKLGNVDMKISLGLAAGSLLGGFFGASAASLLPELYLRILFAVIALWTALRYIKA